MKWGSRSRQARQHSRSSQLQSEKAHVCCNGDSKLLTWPHELGSLALDLARYLFMSFAWKVRRGFVKSGAFPAIPPQCLVLQAFFVPACLYQTLVGISSTAFCSGRSLDSYQRPWLAGPQFCLNCCAPLPLVCLYCNCTMVDRPCSG